MRPVAPAIAAHDGAEGGDRPGRGRLRPRPARPARTGTSPRYVDDGRLPGWLLAVSRHGRLAHVSTYGQRDLEAGLPVETDTIFRIYSMTKPITAVAALSLWEQGGFELNDPVRRYIPSFADLAGVAGRLGRQPGDRAGHRGDAGLAPVHATPAG